MPGMPSVLQPLATTKPSVVSEIMFSLLSGLSTRVVGVEGQNGAPSRARARSSRGRRLAADGPGDRGRRPVAPPPQHRFVFKLVRRQYNAPRADEAA